MALRYHVPLSVLRVVLGDPPLAAEPPEVPAGRSVFPRSAAFAAAAGSVPRLEAVRLRSCSARPLWFRLGSAAYFGLGVRHLSRRSSELTGAGCPLFWAWKISSA